MHPELRRWSFRGWLRANGHDPNLFGAREESGGGEGGGRGGEKWKAWNKGKEGKKGEEKEEGGEEGRMEGEGGEGEERAVGGEGVETLRVQLSEQYTQEKLALFSSYVGEVRLALFLSYVGEVRLALFLSYVGEVRLALFSSYVGEVRLALFLSYVGEVRLALFLSYVGEEVRVRVERCDSKTRSVFVTQRGADLEDEERVERREQLQHRLEAGDVVTSTVVYIGDMNMTVQVDGVNVMIHYDSIRQLKQGPVDTWPFPIGHVATAAAVAVAAAAAVAVAAAAAVAVAAAAAVAVAATAAVSSLSFRYPSFLAAPPLRPSHLPVPAGACALQQARCKRSYLRHLKNSLPPPPLPLSPPSSAPSVSPLLRSLCLPPPPLPLSPPLLRSLCLPPPPLPLSPPSSAPSVSPLLRSLSFKPLMHRPVSASARASQQVSPKAPARCTGATLSQPPLCFSPLSLSYPARTGQSLPVHVLRRKPVQKRLLIALQPPFPVLMRSSPLFLPYPAPAHTGQSLPSLPVHSLPVHVLRSKPVQKRLLVALELPQQKQQGQQQQQNQGRQQQQQGRQQWRRQEAHEAAESAPSMPLQFEAAAELEAVAASLRETPGITSVTLGRVIGGGALAPGFQIFLASQSDSDYKLVARAGLTIQELLVESDLDKEAIRGAIQQAIGQL
ncbi:unnamed protein product [Closterium sp. NIES-64]|nr:unnamed protein product [Closterium sp. NIES-64]